MKSFQTLRLTVFALAIVFSYVASATPISGKVADAGTGEAIIGATIYDSRSHVGVVTDAEGNFNPFEQKKVQVKVEGAAVLQGFGSADPQPLRGYQETEWETFDGKVLAVIRSAEEAGPVKVTFTAEGVAPAVVELETR